MNRNAKEYCLVRDKSKNIPDEKQKRDYSGIHYTVGFKASKEICLTGLDFLGPAKGTSDYLVKVKVQHEYTEEEASCWPFAPVPYTKIDVLFEHSVQVKGVQKGETIPFRFPFPVKIEEESWTDVKFQLNGAETTHMSDVKRRDVIDLEGGFSVEFDLHQGSMQLSKIYFIPIIPNC